MLALVRPWAACRSLVAHLASPMAPSWFALYYITLMWFFNARSQKVADMVHQLKEDLQDVYVPSENLMVIYEGQEVTASFMKNRIVIILLYLTLEY